jgi:DNA-binding NtrC family response regulator
VGPHWKVLLVGLAEHQALIEKLSAEGQEVVATDNPAEAYLHIATSDYNMIIVDADDSPAETEVLCKWIAERRLMTVVIQLTHWRAPVARPRP